MSRKSYCFVAIWPLRLRGGGAVGPLRPMPPPPRTQTLLEREKKRNEDQCREIEGLRAKAVQAVRLTPPPEGLMREGGAFEFAIDPKIEEPGVSILFLYSLPPELLRVSN